MTSRYQLRENGEVKRGHGEGDQQNGLWRGSPHNELIIGLATPVGFLLVRLIGACLHLEGNIDDVT